MHMKKYVLSTAISLALSGYVSLAGATPETTPPAAKTLLAATQSAMSPAEEMAKKIKEVEDEINKVGNQLSTTTDKKERQRLMIQMRGLLLKRSQLKNENK